MSLHSIQYIIEILKKARQKKGLSQRALGKKVGVPQSHISKIENGLIDLQLTSLVELARAVDLELFLLSRSLIPTIQHIQSERDKTSKPRPMYRLEDADDEE